MRTTICILLATTMLTSTSNAGPKEEERATKFLNEFQTSVNTLVDTLWKYGIPLPEIEMPGANTNKLSQMKIRRYVSGNMDSHDMGEFEMHFKNKFASVQAECQPKIAAAQAAWARANPVAAAAEQAANWAAQQRANNQQQDFQREMQMRDLEDQVQRLENEITRRR